MSIFRRKIRSPESFPVSWGNEADDLKPCKGKNVNVCVAEGCYGEACLISQRQALSRLNGEQKT